MTDMTTAYGRLSSARPVTSRTRKNIEQMEDDEALAYMLALEEDEKIAAK
jgi:hypothetical protein